MEHPNVTINGRTPTGFEPAPRKRRGRKHTSEHRQSVRRLKRMFRHGRVHPDLAQHGFRALMRVLARSGDLDGAVARKWLSQQGSPGVSEDRKLPSGIAKIEHAIWAVHSGQCRDDAEHMDEYRAIVDTMECLPVVFDRIRAEREREIVGMLEGEFGEAEMGPTKTLDDVVKHVRSIMPTLVRLAPNASLAEAIERGDHHPTEGSAAKHTTPPHREGR